MRILADENVAGETVEAIRRRGHDVAWIYTEAPGASDQEVIRRAINEQRIILTFDKDFGELAFRSNLPAAMGIVLLRVRASDPPMLTSTVIRALASRDDWSGHFSVVEPDRVRMTPLPRP